MTNPPLLAALDAIPSDLIPHNDVPNAKQTSTFYYHYYNNLKFLGFKESSIKTTVFFLSNQEP